MRTRHQQQEKLLFIIDSGERESILPITIRAVLMSIVAYTALEMEDDYRGHAFVYVRQISPRKRQRVELFSPSRFELEVPFCLPALPGYCHYYLFTFHC